MQIELNGQKLETEIILLKELLKRHHINETTPGVAVALNEQVIPRYAWNEAVLREGDRVEIIGAFQGG